MEGTPKKEEVGSADRTAFGSFETAGFSLPFFTKAASSRVGIQMRGIHLHDGRFSGSCGQVAKHTIKNTQAALSCKVIAKGPVWTVDTRRIALEKAVADHVDGKHGCIETNWRSDIQNKSDIANLLRLPA